MAIRMTAADYADKWVKRTQAATEDYKKGIDRVTEAPGIKAATKVEKMRAGINEAIDSGKWQERVAKVTLGEWKSKAKDVGAGRISAGAEAARVSQVAFAAELFTHIEQSQNAIANMPDNTVDQRIDRSSAFQREMHKFRRTS